MKRFKISGKIIILIIAILSVLSFAFTSCTDNTDSKEETITYRVKYYLINGVGYFGDDYSVSPTISLNWTSTTKMVEAGSYISFEAGDFLTESAYEILIYFQAKFVGWYLDSSYTTEFIGRVESDMVLYAKYNDLSYETKSIKTRYYNYYSF